MNWNPWDMVDVTVKTAMPLVVNAVHGLAAPIKGTLDGTKQLIEGVEGTVAWHAGRFQGQPVPQQPPKKTVFVVHGRDADAWKAMRSFLESLELAPENFDTLMERPHEDSAPSVQQVLNTAFEIAHAVVVLFTPDEEARLLPAFGSEARFQSRANVFFEAGMAFGMHPQRTVLVKFGDVALPSDMAGLMAVEFKEDAPQRRDQLLARLRDTGVELRADDQRYRSSGDFRRVIQKAQRRTGSSSL